MFLTFPSLPTLSVGGSKTKKDNKKIWLVIQVSGI